MTEAEFSFLSKMHITANRIGRGFPFERVIEWRPDFPNDSGGCNLISRAFSLNKFVQSGGDKLVP